MKRLVISLLMVLCTTILVASSVVAQGPSKLRVIEVKDGRLPEGVSGRDITGPLVLMTDGKLPADFGEDYLIKVNATVLSVKSGERLPHFISQTQRERLLEAGISDEKIERAGFVVVGDDVFARGKLERDRIIQNHRKTPFSPASAEQVDHLSWTNVYEAWPPGSNNVSSSASQWSLYPGTLRETGVTMDWDIWQVVWSDDRSVFGTEHGIGGTVLGIDGHYYYLTATFWYQGVMWDDGADAMTL